MDEMKISSKFMQNLVSRIIRKVVNKKVGIDPDISFGAPIEVKIDGDNATIHIDVTANIKTEELQRIINEHIFS